MAFFAMSTYPYAYYTAYDGQRIIHFRYCKTRYVHIIHTCRVFLRDGPSTETHTTAEYRNHYRELTYLYIYIVYICKLYISVSFKFRELTPGNDVGPRVPYGHERIHVRIPRIQDVFFFFFGRVVKITRAGRVITRFYGPGRTKLLKRFPR